MQAGGLPSRLMRHAWCGLAVLLLGGAVGHEAAWSAEPIEYSLSVTGVKKSALKNSIIDVTQLLDKSKRPVTTLRALRRRVETSLPRVTALLRARAYYGATQEFRIERKSEKSAEIVLKINLGPVYRIGRYDIRYTGYRKTDEVPVIPPETLGLKTGDRARSDKITAADALLLAALGRQGYPLARIDERPIIVDHKARTLSVTVHVDTGKRALFGRTMTEGLDDVAPALVDRHITWERGQQFDRSLLEKLRQALRQTGLFSSVLVRHAEQINDDGGLDVTVSVKERKHRSIGAGGSFSTTEGVLGKLFWEHRNLWGHGERLKLRAEVGEIRQGAFGDLRISDFGARDQDLVLDARVMKEEPDGFVSIETASTARLERRFSEIYAGSAGIGFEQSNVEENETDRNFSLLTLPVSFRRDTSDNLLDPSKGNRGRLTFTPNIGILGTDTSFFAARFFDAVYVPLMAEKKLILAGWARIGSIFGDSTLDIPANKRLFSGGPGSVRGYALNSIGPLDVQNDPVGGRSSTEFGAEIRWRIWDPIGVVAFAEAGGVYDDPLPEWGNNLQWGAGVGVRYHTRIGPLRLDVAVPLNRRNSIDDSFQILVSLGQAF